MRKHPTDLHLEGLYFELGDQGQAILEHLAGCPACRERLAHLRRRQGEAAGPPAPAPGALSTSRALPFALALARERDDAPELFVELLRRPAERRGPRLRSDARYHTWGVFELLVERSLETATRDPLGAEELGGLALLLSDYLDGAFYGARTIEDLRARAWAHIGNARRVRSDLAGAGEALAVARAHLRRGTGDPLEHGILLDLEASLRRDQRQLAEAAGLFRRAAGLFLGNGDPHRAGRSLFKLSTVHYFQGDLEEALGLLRRSLELLDLDREPRLRLCVQHNLAFYLTEAGRFEEAREVYREARALYREFQEPWVQSRRKWVRGRILRGLGHPVPAETLLLAARDGFLGEGVAFDTALVSLELATLYAEQGRTVELKRLVGEMMPVFTSLQIHREALAALAVLLRAVEAESAGLEVLKTVADYLRQAEREPDLPFPGSEPSLG